MTVVQSGDLERYAAEFDLPQVNSRLAQFAVDGKAAFEMAAQLAPTPFVPNSYKWDAKRKVWFPVERVVATVAAAWLAGAEVGLRPMQSLQAIDVIDGRPALNAMAMRALVQSHGHDIWTEESAPEGAPVAQLTVTLCGQRKGSDHIEKATWTWARARQAALTGKQNWERHPLAMLTARATGEIARRIAADVLMGLAYTAEELQDEAEDAAPAAEQVTLRRRKQEPVPQPEALPAGEEGSPQAGDEAGDGLAEAVQEAPEASPEPAPAAQQQEGSRCNNKRSDGAQCERFANHDGRHFYGRGPEVPEQRQETPQAPPVAQPEPEPAEDLTADEVAAQEAEGEALFPDVSDEENEAAFLAEQEERAKSQPVVEEPPVAQGESADNDDDPWADFR